MLGKKKEIEAATNSYIDDILVDETAVTAAEIVEHLDKFGFATKSSLEEGDARDRGESEV